MPYELYVCVGRNWWWWTFTTIYKLPKGNSEIPVCRKCLWTPWALQKRRLDSHLKLKKRNWDARKRKKGGRVQSLRNEDEILLAAVLDHVNRYSIIESNYCRQSSSKEYLHPDLTISKMVNMFNIKHKVMGLKASYFTYRDQF